MGEVKTLHRLKLLDFFQQFRKEILITSDLFSQLSQVFFVRSA